MDNKPFYLDTASTTKVDQRVLDEMLPYFNEFYGNASSNHVFGQVAKNAIENSRKKVASLINSEPEEIIFNSGSTESINTAIKGYLMINQHRGNHIITVKTEHKAVLATCEYLETLGFEVTYLNVDNNGLISLKELNDAITPNTLLISVMYVNNETGVIQPIKQIGEIAKANNVVFFCDATQAVGKVDVNVDVDNIDMLCFSGHKLNGPKGVGVLFKRKGIEIPPLIHGGGQENGIRGGTYNTPGIVGLGKACEIAFNEFDEIVSNLNSKRIKWETYFKESEEAKINFQNVKRAPHIISVTLKNNEAEEFLMLKAKEFVASTGSACNSAIIENSHVLKSISLHENNKIIRVSF